MSQQKTEEQPILITKNVTVPLPFFFNLAAGASHTLISSAISVNFKIKNVEAHFRDDAAHNLLFYILSSPNRTASTTTVPPDTNVVSSLSPTPYLAGEGEIVELDLEYEPQANYQYIKVFATNNNAYAMTGLVIVTIEGHLKYEADEESILPITEELLQETGQLQNQQLAKVKNILDVSTSMLKGTPRYVRKATEDYVMQVEEKAQGKFDQFIGRLNIPAAIPVTIPLSERYKFTRAWLDNSLKLTFDTMNDDGILNMFLTVFGGTGTEWRKWLSETFGIEQKINDLLTPAFEEGMLKPVKQFWKKMYQPEYPSPQDMINMVVKEVLPVKDFKENMTYLGYSDFWSEKYWAAHYQQPDFGTILQAYWRGGIKEEDLEYYLKLVDLDPRYNENVWLKLKERIPAYQDLINMRVKEVIDQQTFEKGLNYQGYFGEWGQRLWDAHFMPPTLDDILRAFRRGAQTQWEEAGGVTRGHKFGAIPSQDIEAIKDLSILLDYDPRYWTFFMQRLYEDPSPRQARWGYEEGAITAEKVYDLSIRAGLTPEDAKWFTQMQIGFQERPYITRYMNALMTAYIGDVITAEELTSRIEAIPRRKEIADWIIKIADVRKEIEAAKPTNISKVSFADLKILYKRGKKTDYDVIEWYKAKGYSNQDAIIMGQILQEVPVTEEPEKTLSASELKQMYIMDIITEDEFRTKMMLHGFEIGDVDKLVSLYAKVREEKESGGQKHALSTSEMFNAFKWYQITEDELRTNLQLRGLTLEEANRLIDTKKAQWKNKEGWTETKPEDFIGG